MNNKRPLIMLSCTVILLTTAYFYVNKSSPENATEYSYDANSNEGSKTTNQQPTPTVKVPPRASVSASIDALAEQIVALSANQDEAYNFLVEAKSYRIQDIRTLRTESRAIEEKARYDSEFWEKKRANIDAELAKELDDVKSPSVETQNFRNNSQNLRNNTQINGMNNSLDKSDLKNNKDVVIHDFYLRAIIEAESGFIAKISYKGRNLSAKKGELLMGKVKVSEIDKDFVKLLYKDESLNLYTY